MLSEVLEKLEGIFVISLHRATSCAEQRTAEARAARFATYEAEMRLLDIEQAVRPAPPHGLHGPYEIQRWEVDFLQTREVLRGQFFGIPDEAKTVRFPIRMLRYWFAYHLLAAEYRRARRGLEIVELGTHNGQMRIFTRLAAQRVRDRARAPRWSRWLGVDAVPQTEDSRNRRL